MTRFADEHKSQPMVSLLQMASPVLAVIVFAELLIGSIAFHRTFDRRDSWANIALGFGALVIGVIFKTFWLNAFMGCQRMTALDFGMGEWLWVPCILFTDLAHYACHRMSHRVRLLWTAHVTHHSSQRFNFSVAVRVPVFQQFYRHIFFLPLVLLGFSASMVITCEAIITLYQFFMHNEFVGKLGVIERVFVTPSHHRVHHASNAAYLDKNYGGLLIIWDKLFGSFAEEAERPIYGLTKPLKTYNPLRIAFHELLAMCRDVRKSRSFKDAMIRVFGRPV